MRYVTINISGKMTSNTNQQKFNRAHLTKSIEIKSSSKYLL